MKLWIILSFLFGCICRAALIKDIAEVAGLRPNPLLGMGLVVGLPKTGDKSEAALKALRNLLRKQNFGISERELAAGNVALVTVTAQLPPMARKGSQIDVTVSSIGDARSLAGGMLLTTFLRALDNKIYAVAQGILNQDSAGTPTIGIVTNGAVVEKEVPVALFTDNRLILRLKNPDFNTARRITEAINQKFGTHSKILDLGSVTVQVPEVYRKEDRMMDFIAEIYELSVTPAEVARVVINERTGTVIVGESVTISPVTIVHQNINVRIAPEPGEKAVTVEKLTGALFALGVSARDVVAIFRMLKTAGALHAELVIV